MYIPRQRNNTIFLSFGQQLLYLVLKNCTYDLFCQHLMDKKGVYIYMCIYLKKRVCIYRYMCLFVTSTKIQQPIVCLKK